MSEREKVYTILPDAEVMLQRLIAVDGEPHLQAKFYPILLKDAGAKLSARGVVMMQIMAIYDYTQGMPAVMTHIMYRKIPRYIDALVTDPKVAEAAKAFHAKVMQTTLRGKSG